MPSTHVFHIVDYLQPTGGAEKRLYNDLKRLDKRKIRNTVFCFHTADPAIVANLRRSGYIVYLPPSGKWYTKFLYLIRVLRSVKPDIVHTQLFYADVLGRTAAKLCGVPVILSTVQSSAHEPDSRFYYSRYRRLLDLCTTRFCTRIIAVSEFVKRSIAERLFVNPAKITVIPNYVERMVLQPRRKTNAVVLCSIGKLNPAKGQLELIQALRTLAATNKLLLILAGDGSSRLACEREAAKCGLRDSVIFYGDIAKVQDLLATSDAFVFPTHSEGLSFALLEAVLAKRPCIISAISPNFEIIKPENCFSFTPKHPHSLAAAIRRFLTLRTEHPQRLAAMVNRAYADALRKFDSQTHAKQLERLYLQLRPARGAMRPELLKFLRCPRCTAPLTVAVSRTAGADITEGMLWCRNGCRYPIRNGIPRFVSSDAYARSFSYEWAKHRRTQYDSHNRLSEHQLAQYLAMDLRKLKGKLILDAGCGSGRFMEIALRYGAVVVGVDLSYAVDVAREQLENSPRAHFVQADLTRLPFAPGTFDLIYSLGVLHHTPNAAQAFSQLPPLLKRGGTIAIFVYSSYNKVISTSSAFWRLFTTRLPKPILYGLSFLAIPLYYLYRIPILGTLLKGVFVISMDPDPMVRALDTFDWYSPKYQSKHTHAEVATWFTKAGLRIVAIPPREVSLVGVKP